MEVTHKVDHEGEALAQLRMLRALGVARDRLEEVFGYTGLARYEQMLALEDERKPIDAEFSVIENVDAMIAKEMEDL